MGQLLLCVVDIVDAFPSMQLNQNWSLQSQCSGAENVTLKAALKATKSHPSNKVTKHFVRAPLQFLLASVWGQVLRLLSSLHFFRRTETPRPCASVFNIYRSRYVTRVMWYIVLLQPACLPESPSATWAKVCACQSQISVNCAYMGTDCHLLGDNNNK